MMDLYPTLREHTAEIIENFIVSKIDECHAKGVVLGLSGGLDSAVVAKLCARALGPKRILALVLPLGTTQQSESADAVSYARKIGIPRRIIDILPIIETVKASIQGRYHRLAAGNIAARLRMTIIYYHANSMNRLVIGTGNKSELLMGYFTKYGDGGADYMPLGDLYKTQVRELAREIKIPMNILKRPPTAGLWAGQTDESEMGIKYEILDKILYGLELGLNEYEIRERTSIQLNEIHRIHETVKRMTHKRKIPLIPKLGVRTLGADWRE